MKYAFFTVPVFDAEKAQTDLNRFVTNHRIAHVEKQFVACGEQSFWSFCVGWLEGDGPLPAKMAASKRIDYKEVLNADDFAIYAQLREWRKVKAEQEATPPYNVFTNEQLAAIVQHKIQTKAELLKIEGIGDKRADKYSADLIAELQRLLKNNSQQSN